jgi:ERCC4-related helicase
MRARGGPCPRRCAGRPSRRGPWRRAPARRRRCVARAARFVGAEAQLADHVVAQPRREEPDAVEPAERAAELGQPVAIDDARVERLAAARERRQLVARERLGRPGSPIAAALPQEHRRGILDRLRTGQTRVVVNVGVLSEGWDEPSLECIVIATSTRSQVKYAQIAGRGLRPYPGKTDCLIIDVVGVRRHSIPDRTPFIGPPAVRAGG